MKRHRRAFLYLAASAAALPAISQMAAAQAYPTRPITLIVPFGAGGPTDVAARIVADHMSRTLGRSLIVENVPGAGGTTATTRTMRSTPDGYTVQIGHVGTHATAPLFYPNLAYKPDADFAPIGMVSQNTFLIGANKTLPPNELNEFMAYLRVNHQRMNMGHAGVGSVTHLTGILFNGILGLKPALVPFNSAAAAMNALIAGHVDYMSAPVAEAAQHVRGGTIKAFAVAILGGITSASGVMLAGLAYGLIEALVTAFLGSVYTQIVVFSVVILALAFMPNGLLGRAAVNKV